MNIIRKNLTLAETIAHRNPEVANELLMRNGYPHSPDRDVLAKQLNNFLLTQRENALKQLAEIHPDRELISSFNGEDSFSNADGDEMPVRRRGKKACRGCGRHHSVDGFDNCCGHADGEYSNCSGCGGSCGAKAHFNADGGGGSSKGISNAALVNKEMLAIVGVIALATVALIAISRPNNA